LFLFSKYFEKILSIDFSGMTIFALSPKSKFDTMKDIAIISFLCLAISCGSSAQASFQDVSVQAGLTQTGLNYGVAVADFNNDGLEDVFATRSLTGGMLYQNMGDGTFTNITSQAGISTSPSAQFAVWGDVNNDGWLDLFIGARDEGNALYINNQNGSFTDLTAAAGVSVGGKVKAVLFADVNKDGWLDIYIARLGLENILYRSNGNPNGTGVTFTNFIYQSGAIDPGISMGAVFFDYDNDGDLDLYLTHDNNMPNILYRNNGNGTFNDVSIISGTNIASFGMGADVGDVNNDGWLDIYITNLGPNTLLLNNGNGSFSNITQLAGVGDPGMGWGCSFLDYNNDGWQDIYVANDSYFSPFPNLLYRNNGNNTFSVVSTNTPLHSMEGGYGFSCFDFNNDGNLDIYLANYGGTIGNQLFKNNETNANSWLKIKTIGVESNKAGIGAKVKLEVGNRTLVDEVSGGSGWASQNSLIQHFGLGPAVVVDLVTVRWPSGIIDSFENVATNQLLEVEEGETDIVIVDPEPTPDPDTLKWIVPFAGPTPKETEEPTLAQDRNGIDFQLEIQPNPAREMFYLHFEDSPIFDSCLKIRVLDNFGRQTVLRNEVKELNSTKIWAFDVSDLPPGIYLVQMLWEDSIVTKRLIKI
jgi:enediyne biosynthesis protein E4